MKVVHLTKEGLQKLQSELDELRTIRRPSVIERIARARELGDLSENAEYSDAREEQGFIEGRVLELEEMLRHVVMISDKHTTSDFVVLGSTVACDLNGQVKEYTIVGANEADPISGRISNESPLGQAFLGKKIGEVVEIKVPKGTMKCLIKNIS